MNIWIIIDLLWDLIQTLDRLFHKPTNVISCGKLALNLDDQITCFMAPFYLHSDRLQNIGLYLFTDFII